MDRNNIFFLIIGALVIAVAVMGYPLFFTTEPEE